MASPFHVDGEFSPLRALMVAVLLALVLAQVVAMAMVTRGQVLHAAEREVQARLAPAPASTPSAGVQGTLVSSSALLTLATAGDMSGR